MSDTLLEIIARLQQPGAFLLAQGRHILLDQARKRARARLGLLFLLDPAGLLLVEQCGHAPRRLAARDGAPIPVDGLFGAALREQGLLSINENDDDPRILPAERAWMWHGGRVLLCAVGVGAALDEAIDGTGRQETRRGVMALFTDAHVPAGALSEKAEQDILLCAALLGSYLDVEEVASDADVTDAPPPDAQLPDAHKGHPYRWADRPASSGVALGGVAAVYEAGLDVDDADRERDEQGVCQRVVDALRDALDATSGGLWLYAPSRGRFVWRAGSGKDSGIERLVGDELAQVAGGLRQGCQFGREQYGARVVTWSPGRMVVLHMLEYGGSSNGSDTVREIVGAVAFVIEGRQDISEEQHLLLAYGCRAAATVVRDWQRRAMERQATIDAERSRIGRDIHDGPAQQ
ncbi:MAG TPA: hypothetical protein VGT44_03070, partial [Ktedonobacteraceae bacterium]|nr:hypothetical protein [Ktedonobacteraceae bacterium]